MSAAGRAQRCARSRGVLRCAQRRLAGSTCPPFAPAPPLCLHQACVPLSHPGAPTSQHHSAPAEPMLHFATPCALLRPCPRGDEEADDNSKRAAELAANHWLASLPESAVLEVGNPPGLRPPPALVRPCCCRAGAAASMPVPQAWNSFVVHESQGLAQGSAAGMPSPKVFIATGCLPPARPTPRCSASGCAAPPRTAASSCRWRRRASGTPSSGCGAWCACRGCTTCTA